MQSLNLYIKNRTWINLNSIMFLDILCKTYLILILNVHEFLTA